MRIGGSWRGLSHASDQRELIHVLGSLFQQLCNMDPWDIGGNGFEWASMLGCGVWLRVPRIDVGHAALLEITITFLAAACFLKGAAQVQPPGAPRPAAPSSIKFRRGNGLERIDE